MFKKWILIINLIELKRAINKKLELLYKTYQEKSKSQKVEPQKKIKPNSLTSYIQQPEKFRLPS